MSSFWVYILASCPGGTLYVGVTNNLVRRVYEHREGLAPGFTKKYGVKMLVYYEAHDTYSRPFNARKTSSMVARMEDRPDLVRQSRMARSVC